MYFHALTFAGSQGSCLNTRQLGLVLKNRARDPASINAMKQICVIVILAYLPDFSINRAETSIKHLTSIFFHLLSQNKMASVSNFRTSLRHHKVIYTRATFSRTKASVK